MGLQISIQRLKGQLPRACLIQILILLEKGNKNLDYIRTDLATGGPLFNPTSCWNINLRGKGFRSVCTFWIQIPQESRNTIPSRFDVGLMGIPLEKLAFFLSY